MSGLTKILIVEDDTSLANQLKWLLKKEHEVNLASTSEEARKLLAKEEYSIVLLDLGLPPHPENPTEGLNLLPDIVKKYPTLQVIILTAHGDMQIAREALSLGAYDFLTKPVDENLLYLLIKRAFFRKKLEAEFWEEKKYDLPVPMLVASEKTKAIIQTARDIAALPVSCLILGETGTGKELIAQIIHYFSPRKNRPLIVVECPSIPITLGEAELFGAEKGSYTGSVARREGRIREAEGGTLFLDEVGELTVEMQSKLLRFLETHNYTPIGGKTSPADVRIIAATNRDLTEEVKRGRFRLDLYHRLCQVEVSIPPLRERKEEIIPLAHYLLSKLSHDFRISHPSLTPEAQTALCDYQFPGNIRELKNMLSRALILSKGLPIGPKELGLEKPEEKITFDVQPGFNLIQAKNHLEKQWIEEALKKSGGKIAPAASDLNIPRTTLYDLMKKHGIGSQESEDVGARRAVPNSQEEEL
ncbi:MAG TPA: sigma-54 dependent transcriptional regulator [Thermodesulfobacteriota bacterium]|nr:sigma-54 dependent transcriptional regulator [Thermodesulfobacteriota bacterium]